MKNLQKFTKNELINKLKSQKLENQGGQSQSYLHKLVDSILQFKSIILKITLITFLIKWIKKYSLIQKLWHIFSVIGSSLLGLSMVDIYALDLLNWIKDTSIYKWYSDLFNSHKTIETIKPKDITDSSIPSFMKRVQSETENNENWDSESSERISRNITEINRRYDQKISDITSFYENYKNYFIIGALSVTALASWYFFDEIKDGYFSSIEYIKSKFNNPGTGSAPSSTGSIENSSTQSNESTILAEFKKYFKDKIYPGLDHKSVIETVKDKIKTSSENINQDISLIDNSQPVASSSNINKGVLTSQSLEDLNSKAEESWSEGASSPGSTSSTETITPSNIDKGKNPEINTLTPLFISENWKSMWPSDIKEKINILDELWESDDTIWTRETGEKLATILAYLENRYNSEVKVYKSMIDKLNIDQINTAKQSFYYFREYLHTFHGRILPIEENKIIIGKINDEIEILDFY